MATVRELVTRFGFKADVEKVERFGQAVDEAKRTAQAASKAVRRMAEDTGLVTKAASESARSVRQSAKQTGDAMKGAAGVVKGAAHEAAQATRTLSTGAAQMANEVRRVMERLPRELRAVDEQAKLFGSGFDHARAKVEALERAIRSLTMAGVTADNVHLQGLNTELMAVRAGMTASGEHGGKGKGLGALAASLSHHLAAMGALYFGFQAAERQVEHFAEFQQGLQKAGAAMLATGEEIARLKDQILRNAGDLGQAPRKLAEVDMELAGQGFHEHQVETMMPVAAKLARAGLTDSKVSAEILGSTNRSFYGEDVSQSGKVGDIIARVHDLGGIQIPQLLETFKYAGPAYHALGQSLEDLGAITAILGRAGIKGSMAGTGTRTMLLRLAAPMVAGRKKLEHIGLGEELKKGQSSTVVKELGLHVEDDKGNMLPMVTIMKELVAKTKGMGNVRRAAIFKDMFGLETVTEALALANAAGERFDEVSHDVHNANGTLDRMYKIMSKGLIPAWDRFTAKLEVFASLVLERASPGLEGLLDGVGWLLDRGRDFILWLDEATDHGKRLHWAVVALKLAVVALLPFLVAAEIAALPGQLAAIGAVITGTVIPAIVSATRAVIGFIIANAPIAAVVAVFALLALVFEDIYTWATGGESALGGLWDSIAEEGGTVLYGLWKFFAQDLPAVFTGFINGVGPAMSGMWNGIGQLCQMAWEGIKSATGQAMDAVKAAFSGAFENVYNTVVGWIDKAIAKVHEVADAARRIIPGQGDDGGGTSPGGFGAGPLRSPGLPSWVLGAAGTPALAGVTPSADAAARAGGGGPVVPVSAHTEVHVNVGRDSSPSQTGHVVADHVEHAVRKAVHGAARVLPKQKR